MRNAMRRWSFPAPENGTVSVSTTYQFRIEGGSQADADRPLASTYRSFVLTRLHYRYGRDALGEDLVFRAAEAVTGGREVPTPDGSLEQGAQRATVNNFQGRYAIRHEWTGPIECDDPQRGLWGGNPSGEEPAPAAATNTAAAARGGVDLATLLVDPLPALGISAASTAPSTEEPVPEAEETAEAAPSDPASSSAAGCGCRVGATDPRTVGGGVALGLVLALLAWRRRGAAR